MRALHLADHLDVQEAAARVTAAAQLGFGGIRKADFWHEVGARLGVSPRAARYRGQQAGLRPEPRPRKMVPCPQCRAPTRERNYSPRPGAGLCQRCSVKRRRSPR